MPNFIPSHIPTYPHTHIPTNITLYPSAIGAPWKENNINFNLNIKSTQAKYNGDATSDNRRAFQKNRDHKRCNTTLRAVRIDLQCHTQILRLPFISLRDD